MTAPHLRFRHLDAAVLTATAALLEVRTTELRVDEAHAEFQLWADTAAASYGLPRVTIVAGAQLDGDRYGYTPEATIRLRRYSIVALLEAFRRHMQAHGTRQASGTPDDDARGWALSLYYQVRPRQLARLAAAGKIPGLTATDLTTPDPVGRIAHQTPADHVDQGRDRAEPGIQVAGQRLQDARDFIRRAAAQGSITADERDRYLAMIDAEQRRTPGPVALMEAIRERAIELYEDDVISHGGLSDFLHAAGLEPHDD